MLRAFGHPAATCCWLKFENGQVFHATFVDFAWCYSRLIRFLQQCCAWVCALVRFSTRNMSQHVATGRPNACNMLRPTMLRSVAFKWCDRLAGACKCWANSVGICCVEMLLSFGRGSMTATLPCESFCEKTPNHLVKSIQHTCWCCPMSSSYPMLSLPILALKSPIKKWWHLFLERHQSSTLQNVIFAVICHSRALYYIHANFPLLGMEGGIKLGPFTWLRYCNFLRSC